MYSQYIILKCFDNLFLKESTKIGEIFLTLVGVFFFQKPIIVCVPQNERSWQLGDILKKISSDQSTKGLQSNMAKNPISKSSLDLSSPGPETLQRSQSQANVCHA